MTGSMNIEQLKNDISRWLQEDMPFGDITSQNLPDMDQQVWVMLMAKEDGIICGLEVFEMVIHAIDPSIEIDRWFKDGDRIKSGDEIAKFRGSLKNILMGERVALNLLQRMSGIATLSKKYAEEVAEFPTRIVDTRKTTPGLRQLEKYAVRIGGCYNHRFSLSDAVMIKDNHIKTAGSITAAVKSIRKQLPHTVKIEVEVETLEGLQEALQNHVDIVMLDNMNEEDMTMAVAVTGGNAVLEASGNMTLERLKSVAATGVDVISVGALTHSVSGLDISLKFQ